MWSTNNKNRHDPKALYFDAENNPHYGKYKNDHWNAHANNCELRWNPATGRVEIYALRDISLNEELGIAYGAPFWYQPNNGITTKTQARKIKSYYQRATLPWLPKTRSTNTHPTCHTTTPNSPSPPP